ncbi:hypothetical protein [Haliangium sp.]
MAELAFQVALNIERRGRIDDALWRSLERARRLATIPAAWSAAW